MEEFKEILVMLMVFLPLFLAMVLAPLGAQNEKYCVGSKTSTPNFHMSMLSTLAEVEREQRENGTYNPKDSLEARRIISKDYLDRYS